MSSTVSVTVLSIMIFLCLVISLANAFTIFVFWINRRKLHRTWLLLLNLAVADLLVGFTEILVVTTFVLPRHIMVFQVHDTPANIARLLEALFSSASVFFLVLIAVERAFAVLWPLRHRVTSTKAYIYSVGVAWLTGVTLGAMHLLVLYDLMQHKYYMIVYGSIIGISLAVVCGLYLLIRTRLSHRSNAFDATRNKQIAKQKSKLSKTLFIVVAGSVMLWVPSLVIYFVHCDHQELFPAKSLIYMATMLHLTNSLLNPIIYSLRLPVFRETLKRLKNKLKVRKRSKEYTINLKIRTGGEIN